MDQKEVWNKIASPWKIFRTNPDKEVIEFLNNKKGNILDLACGSGRNFTKLNGTIHGVDFSENMLGHARQFIEKNNIKAELTNANMTKLPFKSNFFDSAIFIRSLHCITKSEDRKKSLKELLRVLKPNAEALISVWDHDQERFKDKGKNSLIPWKHKGKEYLRYYYLYDKKEFLELLEKTGFEITKIMDKKNSLGLYSNKNIIVIVRKQKN